ncbi:MAG: YbbR-like domain-containing protein [Acutalibacteraceae bacterium]
MEKKTAKNKKEHKNLGKLFYNDKFVMIFSALTAFILWIVVSTTSQESIVSTVTGIPISLPELSNELTFFNTEDLTAEVRISGNALIVSTISKSDIYVTAADVSEITSPGEYTINLVPKKGSIKSDFNFDTAPTPSSVTVYVDRYTEKEFAITNQVSIQSVAENCYASSSTLSQQTVTISGAESIINEIAEVAAVYTFPDTLYSTTTQTVPIVLYDANHRIIQSEYIKMNIESTTVTIPILETKRVPIEVKYINVPESVILDSSWVSVSPSELYIAAPEDVIGNLDKITTSEIDLSTINLSNNNITVPINLPTGCKNLDSIEQVTVQFDMKDMAQKSFSIESFSVINQTSERQATVRSKSLTVTLVGPKSEIYELKSEDITAVIDMNSDFPMGLTEAPVQIKLPNNASDCWVYNKYTVTINVSETGSTNA